MQEPYNQLEDFIGPYVIRGGYESWKINLESDPIFHFEEIPEMKMAYKTYSFSGFIVVSKNTIQLRTFDNQVLTKQNDVICHFALVLNCNKSHTLIPIKWGDRRYLVFTENMNYWCANERYKPTDWIVNTPYYIRSTRATDKLPPVEGIPTLLDGSLACPYFYVNALAIDPLTPTILYAGTASNGVFKSTNGGKDWDEMNQGLITTNIRALVIDPSTPTTLYAGTPGGVFKSTNAGSSWNIVNTGLMEPKTILP